MIDFIQYTLTGLMIGSVYAVIALGFVLVYKSTGILNFAVGSMLALLSFICWTLMVPLGLPLWISILITLAAGALLGLLVERLTLRPILGQSILALIVMTIALSYFIDGLTILGWGGEIRSYPSYIPAGMINIGDIYISIQHLICFLTVIILLVCFMLFFRFTKLGLGMRAVAEGHQIGQSTGIDVKVIFAAVWAVAVMLSAAGGFLLGNIAGVRYTLNEVGLKALPAALLGGLDSVPGAIVGGLVIGILESWSFGYLEPIIGGGVREAFPFFIMIVILIIRPYGLFGLTRIERV